MSKAHTTSLRTAEPGDLKALHALEKSCFADQAWDEQQLVTEFSRPGGHFLIRVVQNDVRAMAIGWTIAGESELARICVHPDTRRSGLATHLLSAFETEAAQSGSIRIYLEVRADNHGARSFYTSQAYAQCGRRTKYYQDGTDAVVMEKRLFQAQPQTQKAPNTTEDPPC